MKPKLFLSLFASLDSLLKIGKHANVTATPVSCDSDSPLIGSRPPSDTMKARLVSLLNGKICGIFRTVNQSKVFDAVIFGVAVNVVNFFTNRIFAIEQLPNDPVRFNALNVVNGSEKIATSLRNRSEGWFSSHFCVPIVSAAFGCSVARLEMTNRTVLPC